MVINLQYTRKGIAMIELIFAIVVIGITLMSIPQLLSVSAKGGYTALQQEAIAQVSSDVSLLLTREWDEEGSDSNMHSPILKSDGNAGLSERNGARSRSYHSATGETYTATTTLEDDGDGDDIDDIAHDGLVTLEPTGIDSIDKNILISYTVEYALDDPTGSAWDTSNVVAYNEPFSPATPASTTNIKRIKAVLISNSGVEELKKEISINAFSCNVGSFQLERKEL